jgi:hypothetical protein
VWYLREFSSRGFPINRKKLRKIAFDFALENGLGGFSSKYRMAGKKWLKGFLGRHRDLKVRLASNVSLHRARCANPTVLAKWYETFEALCRRFGVTDPRQIWNADETGVQDVPKPQQCIVPSGDPAHSIVFGERGELSTLVTYCNAAGLACPPMVIHKGKKTQTYWSNKKPTSWTVCSSKSGYINCDLWHQYALRWIRFLNSHKLLGVPHILIIDGHKSHIFNLAFLNLMLKNNIQVICIPPHTSHVLQPLDVSPFSAFKRYWNSELQDYLFSSGGKKLGKGSFFEVVYPAWLEGLRPDNIRGGFKRSGIYPLNKKAINPRRLRPSKNTERQIFNSECT